jgi:hypothetical protein
MTVPLFTERWRDEFPLSLNMRRSRRFAHASAALPLGDFVPDTLVPHGPVRSSERLLVNETKALLGKLVTLL